MGGAVDEGYVSSQGRRSITGEVWEAFNSYRGELRSIVQVNVGFPISLTSLVAIAAHESYRDIIRNGPARSSCCTWTGSGSRRA
jgi:hypothetical protein